MPHGARRARTPALSWARLPRLGLTMVAPVVFTVVAPVLSSAVAYSNGTAVTQSVMYNVSAQTVFDPYPYNFPDPTRPHDPLPMPPCFGHVIEEATISELQSLLIHRKLTSRQLLKCYVRRIAQVDSYVEYVPSVPILWRR
jgi:hypothetical protein